MHFSILLRSLHSQHKSHPWTVHLRNFRLLTSCFTCHVFKFVFCSFCPEKQNCCFSVPSVTFFLGTHAPNTKIFTQSPPQCVSHNISNPTPKDGHQAFPFLSPYTTSSYLHFQISSEKWCMLTQSLEINIWWYLSVKMFWSFWGGQLSLSSVSGNWKIAQTFIEMQSTYTTECWVYTDGKLYVNIHKTACC